MNKFLLTISIFLSCVSCITQEKKLKTEINYIGTEGYTYDSIPDLRDSTIVLYFDYYFDGDKVQIKSGQKSDSLILSTNEITGTAELYVLGKVTNQQVIELKINEYKPITFIADSNNQLFLISYFPDSLLRINSLFHLHAGR